MILSLFGKTQSKREYILSNETKAKNWGHQSSRVGEKTNRGKRIHDIPLVVDKM